MDETITTPRPKRRVEAISDLPSRLGAPCVGGAHGRWTIQQGDVQPYEAIISTATNHGIARTQRTIRSCAWQCDKQGTDVHKSSGVGCSVSMGRSLGDGSLPLRGALSSFGSLVKNWLGKDQYGADSLGRDYRACRFSAGTRRLEARAADADANSGPDSSRAAGALVSSCGRHDKSGSEVRVGVRTTTIFAAKPI